MTPSVPILDQYPTWVLVVAAAVMSLLGGGVIGAIVYLRFKRDRRIGTRSYRFPTKRGGWFHLPTIFVVAVLLGGCMERAVIVPPTVPVRLAEHLSGVAVWVKDKDGDEVKARADLFPGMIIATDPEDFPTATRARFMNLRRDE